MIFSQKPKAKSQKKKDMKKIKNYFVDTYNELVHKVSWPSWPDLQNSAIIVMIASLIIALVIYAMDSAFSQLMKFIYEMFYDTAASIIMWL